MLADGWTAEEADFLHPHPSSCFWKIRCHGQDLLGMELLSQLERWVPRELGWRSALSRDVKS